MKTPKLVSPTSYNKKEFLSGIPLILEYFRKLIMVNYVK